VNVFVLPEAKATMIASIGEVKREQLQAMKTIDIQTEARKNLEQQFNASNIYLQDLLITRLIIPKSISDAIERKLTQEQLLQEYDFRVQVAEKEKERKKIEALGINLFESISNIPILKWKGLTVTSEIARSNNAKVIVIGTGDGGLPIILNADK
jgi:regulator of protease activity HflC (stomatin/prohibitin superfamily)